MVFTDKQENRTFILLANLKQVMFNHLYPDSFYKNDLNISLILLAKKDYTSCNLP